MPTVALVQGGCFGGGTGMIAACDVVIAADNAMFSIAEVRWGLTAAIIIPQLSDAISARQLRRYALTGERFDAAEAQRIGLVHHVVPLDRPGGGRRGDGWRACSRTARRRWPRPRPGSFESAWGGFDRAAFDALSASHAAKRRSAEAAEGLASFAEKRAANWKDRA